MASFLMIRHPTEIDVFDLLVHADSGRQIVVDGALQVVVDRADGADLPPSLGPNSFGTWPSPQPADLPICR
jgi:hypothetical protein